jgi:iron complex outermembrane receptor protein
VLVRGDAVRDRVGSKALGVASSVISRERLVGPGRQASEVLRGEPGVAVTETGGFGAPATAAVRGATAADTPVYLAGIRINDDVTGTADLGTVPLWLIERVEIYRGNAPLEADRFSAGGVIFFEPRRPAKDTRAIGVYGGSWGARRGWAYRATEHGAFHTLVGISGERATNRYAYDDDGGMVLSGARPAVARRANADTTMGDVWGLARIDVGRGTIDIVANAISREQGVPNLALVPTKSARSETSRALAGVSIHMPVGNTESWVVDARTAIIGSQVSFDDPERELRLLTEHLDLGGTRLEQVVGLTASTRPVRMRVSMNTARETIMRGPGEDDSTLHAARTVARAVASLEYEATSLVTLRALGSGECHHTAPLSTATCTIMEPTGRLGIEAGSARISVIGNIGRYVRVPTLGEMYGISSTVHGNPQLFPESGVSVDVGVRASATRRGAFDGAFVDAFLFAREASDLITFARVSQGFVRPYNVGAARVIGAELLSGIGLFGFLHAELSTTLLEPRDVTDGRQTMNSVLPFRSRMIAAPRVRAAFRRQSPDGLGGGGVQLEAVYQSSRYVDAAGLGIIGEQLSVDAEVFAAWFDGLLTSRLRVADVFDAPRTDTVGYPLPKRTAYFGLETTW